jgi:dTDP-4-amino-4,6-dideoxygalactose transaminase
MDAVQTIARKHDLWLVEDAACALGGRAGPETHAGALGLAGAFSFHPRKSITTGEGGMITTNDERLARLCRSLCDHGASRTDRERHESSGSYLLSEYDVLGFNFRMTDIQGALGCAQMDRLDWILEQRRRRAAAYDEALADLEWLRTPAVPAGFVHGYQAYVCLFAPEKPTLRNVARLHEFRGRLMAQLEEKGIATRQGTHAPVLAGYYARKYDLRPEDFPNATIADALTIALPLFPQMTDAEQEFVCDSLRMAFETLSNRS